MRRILYVFALALPCALSLEIAEAQPRLPQTPVSPAPAGCQDQLETAWNQVADQAINAWSQTKKVAVDTTVRASMKAQFCDFQITAQSAQLPPSDDFKTTLSLTVDDYLNYQIAPATQSPSFSAVFVQKINGGGIARPRAKLNGLIQVTYSKPVDAVKIRGQNREPWTAFLVTIGTATFEGFVANAQACSITVNVKATEVAQVTC